MPTIIKNINDLNKILEQRVSMALKMAQKDIGECIQESIDEYYKEKVFRGGTSAIPLIYDRTYKLLNSMIKTEIVKNGNSLSCQVGISDDYLNYKYPGTNGPTIGIITNFFVVATILLSSPALSNSSFK